jgi:membrane protein
VRGRRREKSGIIEVGERSVRNFFFEHPMATYADYGLTYGSLGAALVLLFYLYLCPSSVLLGAERNAAIYHPPTDAGAKG